MIFVVMKNPFEAFREFSRESFRSRGSMRAGSYQKVDLSGVVQVFDSFVQKSLPAHGTIITDKIVEALYGKVVGLTGKLNLSAGAIEDFCHTVCVSRINSPSDAVIGGLFVSALINSNDKELFFLEFPNSGHLLHFVGYRLPEGKTINIDGNVGDFLGMNLSGGTISVSGNVRNWAALGMKGGKIIINGMCGRFACEWMRGGRFLVSGRIESKGKVLAGIVQEHCSSG